MTADAARQIAHELCKHHVPTPQEIERISLLRQAGEDYITQLLQHGRPGPDLTAAVRKARETQMTVIAGIVVPAVQLPTGGAGSR